MAYHKRVQVCPQILCRRDLRPPEAYGLVNEITKLLNPTSTSTMLNKDIGQTQNAEYQPPAGLVSYPPASCLP